MMKHNARCILAAMLCGCFLWGCGKNEDSMQYVKTAVMYETLYDMYSYPDEYVGKQYHMVGELYVHDDTEDGENIYSIYCEKDGAGLGLELDWSDFTGLEAGDTITVEGRLDRETGSHHGEDVEYLVLRVSLLEKREDS